MPSRNTWEGWNIGQAEALKLLTNKWQTTTEILDLGKCSTNRWNLLRALNTLFKHGEVLRKTIRKGSNRVHTFTWMKK